MAFDYLGLVNDLCNKFNEVPLSESNFASASGVYSDFKNAVNMSINLINQDPTRWPYTHAVQDLVLTPSTVRYSYPTDAKLIDFNTFRLQGSDTLNVVTGKLFPIMYEEYLDYCSDMEYRPDRYLDIPTNVSHSIGRDFVVIPPPKEAYTITYEYHKVIAGLINATDVPTVPEDFKWVIFDGALIYAFIFRGDQPASDAIAARFNEDLKAMRIAYNNRTTYIRSPMIMRR